MTEMEIVNRGARESGILGKSPSAPLKDSILRPSDYNKQLQKELRHSLFISLQCVSFKSTHPSNPTSPQEKVGIQTKGYQH